MMHCYFFCHTKVNPRIQALPVSDSGITRSKNQCSTNHKLRCNILSSTIHWKMLKNKCFKHVLSPAMMNSHYMSYKPKQLLFLITVFPQSKNKLRYFVCWMKNYKLLQAVKKQNKNLLCKDASQSWTTFAVNLSMIQVIRMQSEMLLHM